tara:strand:+ start:4821 stop:5900 length:1080 start_codon:yes stop_codon:yes gene_type:complete
MSTPRALSDFGYVQDVNLGHGSDDQDCGINNNSCAPTSLTNCLVYLQNIYGSELAGLELTGNDYSSWAETLITLRSPAFMNTSAKGPGTTPWGQVNGMEKFLNYLGVGPLATSYQAIAENAALETYEDVIPPGETYPAWLLRGAPTLPQMHQWLETGGAVVINVLWENDGAPSGTAHVLALAGVEWSDINEDGRVDEGEAILQVIDPVDPTVGNYTDDGYQPVGPARATLVSVWQDSDCDPSSPFGLLKFSYQVYQAECGQPFPFADQFPDGNPTYQHQTGWIGSAGVLNIIGGPGGSCCLATGCDLLTEVACENLGGSWTLAGDCDDCAPTCQGDTNQDGVVDVLDLLVVIEGWGTCP